MNKYLLVLLVVTLVSCAASLGLLVYVVGTSLSYFATVIIVSASVYTSTLLVFGTWLRREQVFFLTRETIISDDRI